MFGMHFPMEMGPILSLAAEFLDGMVTISALGYFQEVGAFLLCEWDLGFMSTIETPGFFALITMGLR